jgi:uncharacterized protein YggE
MNRRLVLIIALGAALTPPAAAQAPAKTGTIAAAGSAEIKRQPQALRVQVEIVAKGKDLKEALVKLKERREAVKVLLRGFETAPESVAFGDPTLGGDKTDQQKQFEMMVAQRLRAGGKPLPKTGAQPTVVSLSLKFDAPLKADSAEELLVQAEALQQKIKKADLGGAKDFEKLTPQQEELAEEMEMASMMGGEQGPKPGEPTFVFVGRVSEDEQTKALAEAFANAQRDAQQLAKAAGVTLGPLQHLEQNVQGGSMEDLMSQGYYGYNQYMAQRMQQVASMIEAREAVSMRPGAVVYRVNLTAHFHINPK